MVRVVETGELRRAKESELWGELLYIARGHGGRHAHGLWGMAAWEATFCESRAACALSEGRPHRLPTGQTEAALRCLAALNAAKSEAARVCVGWVGTRGRRMSSS